jgi:putative DNA methylase
VSRRLIDSGTLHYEASVAGFAERYRRGETPQTIHVWWARRPHTAMRALLFACLAEDSSLDGLALMQQLSCSPVAQPLLLSAARREVGADRPELPRVLDMFGGGGTIAFEGACLGVDMHSLDSNELSVFIQRSLLVYSQAESSEPLPVLVKASGKRILRQLRDETADLFPRREQVFGYFWTYSLRCESCGYSFYLSKRPWLSRKKGKRVALRPCDEREGLSLAIHQSRDDESSTVWVGRNGTVACPRCGRRDSNVAVQRCRDELVGTVGLGPKSGKLFSVDTLGTLPGPQHLADAQASTLAVLGVGLPASVLPRWSGIVNPALYGINTHADFLNPRQRVVLLLLIKALRGEYERLRKEEGEATARALVCLLSGLIDQLVDWNCRLSMWIPQNEQVGRAFCGPGVAMLWDYVETDPVQKGPANLWAKLDRIVAGVAAIGQVLRKPTVARAFAQDLPYPDGCFDAIVTDPPYYDNIFYKILADFFFSWKRLLFAAIEPELFARGETDCSRELVASAQRSGDADRAHEDYCRELHTVMQEAERVLKRDGVFALLYGHSSLRGWESLVRAYRPTGLRITSVQPLSIERKQRPRAVASDAVNTCVVFVAHRSSSPKRPSPLPALCEQLRQISGSMGNSLLQAGWSEEDTAIALFAQGVGLLANASSVPGCLDVKPLKAFEMVVRERLPRFRVSPRSSL